MSSESEFSSLIERISRIIQPNTVKYHRVCYLLKVIVQPSLKGVFNGSNLINYIINETLKDQHGGRAMLWYVLKETGACPQDILDKINVGFNEFTIPDNIAEMVHFRSMILKIVSELANDENKATALINPVGHTLQPQVIYSALPKSPEENDYTVPLLKFFEAVEEQCEVEPDNLDNLRQWLTKIGGKKIIKDHVDTFEPHKVVTITCARPPLKRELHTEEERKPLLPKQSTDEDTVSSEMVCSIDKL